MVQVKCEKSTRPSSINKFRKARVSYSLPIHPSFQQVPLAQRSTIISLSRASISRKVKDYFMQLSNSREDLEKLRVLILRYYKDRGRSVFDIAITPKPLDQSQGWYSWEFLIDRRHVIRYSIGPSDRGKGFLGGLELAIGPYFFGPSNFWSNEAANLFKAETCPMDIQFNLSLLDKFWGLADSATPA